MYRGNDGPHSLDKGMDPLRSTLYYLILLLMEAISVRPDGYLAGHRGNDGFGLHWRACNTSFPRLWILVLEPGTSHVTLHFTSSSRGWWLVMRWLSFITNHTNLSPHQIYKMKSISWGVSGQYSGDPLNFEWGESIPSETSFRTTFLWFFDWSRREISLATRFGRLK